MNIVQAITQRKRVATPRQAFALTKDKLGYRDPTSRLLGVDQEAKSATFIVSTSSQDRDGDVVLPSSFRLDNYARNPIWLFGHGAEGWEVPIGLAESPDGRLAVELAEDHVKATCWFDQADPDAMFIWGKVARGLLRTTSIGFKPLDGERLSEGKRPDGGMWWPGWVFRAIDLLEISIVATPSNPEALVLGKGDKVSSRLRECIDCMRGGTGKTYSFASRIACIGDSVNGIANTNRGASMAMKTRKAGTKPARTRRKEGDPVDDVSNTTATPEANAAASDVQAILVPKAQYPDQEAAAKWATDHGYTADTVEDTGEAWGFIQFPADQCTPESAKQIDLDGDVKAVVCQGQVETEGGAEPHPVEEVKALRAEVLAIKQLLMKATTAERPCGCHGKSKVADVRKEESVLDLDDDFDQDADDMEDGGDVDDVKPHSYGALKALIEHCAEHEPRLEQPKVKAFYEKTLATAKQLMMDVHGEGDDKGDDAENDEVVNDLDTEDMSEDEEKALVATIEKMQASTDKRMKEMRSLTGRV